MGKGLIQFPDQGPIVNPMSQNILSLTINDQGKTTLQSHMMPQQTVVALVGVAVDLIFRYIDEKAASTIKEP